MYIYIYVSMFLYTQMHSGHIVSDLHAINLSFYILQFDLSFSFLRSGEKMEEEPPLIESELHQILEEQPYMILMASDSRWEL